MVKSSCSWVTRQWALDIKVGVAYVNIHVLRHLKEELAYALDKWLQVSSDMLFKTVIPLRI